MSLQNRGVRMKKEERPTTKSGQTNLTNNTKNGRFSQEFSYNALLQHIEEITSSLGLLKTQIRKNSKGEKEFWALCPFHDDRNPSFSINLETGLAFCFGCGYKGNIVKVYADINKIDEKQAYKELIQHYLSDKRAHKKVVSERKHIYCNLDGNILYRKIVYKYNDGSKSANFERYEDGKWIRGLNGIKQIPYNLKALDNPVIYISESEKDIDYLNKLGFSGISSGGANNARVFKPFLEQFQNKHIVILTHNDDAGIKFASEIAKIVMSKSKDIKIVEPNVWGNKKGSDVADWIEEQRKQGKLDNEIKEAFLNIINQTKKYEDKPQQSQKPNSADILLQIVKDNVESFFVDSRDELYAVTESGYFSINSKQFRNFIAKHFYEATKKGFSYDVWKNALITIEATGRYSDIKPVKIDLQNRIAKVDDSLFYWLEDGKVVKITSDGWNIIDEPVLFKKYSHQLPQTEPDKNAKIEDAFSIFDFANIDNENDRILLFNWLVSGFIPDIPRAILILTGEQGAGKTTFTAKLKSLIDPSTIDIMSKPPTEMETIQLLDHHYFINFDNLKTISPQFSDLLCKAVTGFGISKRKLFSDDEDIDYRFKRLIALNGIDSIATAPDLLDRSILIKVNRLKNNKTLNELNKAFERVKPKILGAIFTILSRAIKIYQERREEITDINLPRMADWTVWCWSISEACGIGGNSFLKAYGVNIQKQNKEAIEHDIVGQVLIEFMRDKESWEGLTTELFKRLKDAAEETNINANGKYFVATPNALSRKLNKLKTNLRAYGINIQSRHTEFGTKMYIKTIPSVSSNCQETEKMALEQYSRADDIENGYRQESSGYRQHINSSTLTDDKNDLTDDNRKNIVRVKTALQRETDDTDATDDIHSEGVDGAKQKLNPKEAFIL